jgi:hypothetical protein
MQVPILLTAGIIKKFRSLSWKELNWEEVTVMQ